MRILRAAMAMCLLLSAGQASATLLDFEGTTTTKLGAGRPSRIPGSGVATVNALSGGLSDHLQTLQLPSASNMGDPIPVTDPEVTGVIKSFVVTGAASTGTFAPISGGGPLTKNELPIMGTAKICLFLSGCPSFLPLFLSRNDGNTAFGVGGLLTVGEAGALRISLENNPWTLGTGMGVRQTDNSAFTVVTVTGFVHGPASNTSTTALASGVIQLITPTQVTTIGVPGTNEKLSLFGTIRIHFVPEPGLLLLLGSGIVGLVLLGRQRLR